MSLYIVPALFALLIKVGVLAISAKGAIKSPVFFTMVLLFACHNMAEVLGIIEYFNGAQQTQILRWYYLMTVGALAAMLVYSADIYGIKRKFGEVKANVFAGLVIAIVMSLGSLIMFTDLIIAGSRSLRYTMTVIGGDYYWLFIGNSIITFPLIVYFLIDGYRKAQSHQEEIGCAYSLFALAPIVITSVGLMALMGLGAKINATAIIPISTALFLLIILKTERQHRLTDIRRHIPGSLERRTSGQIMEIFNEYACDKINYRDGMAEIEKLLVLHKHDKNGGNVTTTASSMEIPRSSLYSIFRRLDIELKENKS